MDAWTALQLCKSATQTCCVDLGKQDIPEVESIIRLVTPRLNAHWQGNVERAIRELVEALEDIPDGLGAPDVDPLVKAEDRDKALEDLIAALLLSLYMRLGAAPTPARLGILREGTKALLRDGSGSAGTLLDLGDSRVVTYPHLGSEDALLGTRGRAIRREAAIKEHIETYLTSRAVRRPESDAMDPLADIVAWEDTLADILGGGDATSVPDTVDSWAYRWFNIGAATGASQAGQTALVAQNNPPAGPDERTSPFCRWVHGRVVEMSKVDRQIEEYLGAVQEGDPEAQIRSWPFLSAVSASDPKVFRGFFVNAGLPPYHHKCRTRVIASVINVR